MAYLSRNSIEKIAQKVVFEYQRLPKWEGEEQFRIDPKILAEDLLGLSVEYHRLSPDGSILGATACAETTLPIFDTPASPEFFFLDGRTILIEKELVDEGANLGRYHFTLMHEASHQLLGLIFPMEKQASRYRIRYHMEEPVAVEDYWEEWRANTLTAAILMPLGMLCRNMQVFGLGKKMRMLNKVFAPKEYTKFREMAEFMGVSLQALSVRLMQLGLLERNYLEDPYRLVNIFP